MTDFECLGTPLQLEVFRAAAQKGSALKKDTGCSASSLGGRMRPHMLSPHWEPGIKNVMFFSSVRYFSVPFQCSKASPLINNRLEPYRTTVNNVIFTNVIAFTK